MLVVPKLCSTNNMLILGVGSHVVNLSLVLLV